MQQAVSGGKCVSKLRKPAAGGLFPTGGEQIQHALPSNILLKRHLVPVLNSAVRLQPFFQGILLAKRHVVSAVVFDPKPDLLHGRIIYLPLCGQLDRCILRNFRLLQQQSVLLRLGNHRVHLFLTAARQQQTRRRDHQKSSHFSHLLPVLTEHLPKGSAVSRQSVQKQAKTFSACLLAF